MPSKGETYEQYRLDSGSSGHRSRGAIGARATLTGYVTGYVEAAPHGLAPILEGASAL